MHAKPPHCSQDALTTRRLHLQRMTVWAALGMGGAALAGCSKKTKIAVSPIAPGATVLALGDSLTLGTGAPADHSWPSLLQQRSHWKMVNAGVSGETSTQIAQRLPGLLDEYKPALVILCAGGNDFLKQQSAELTRSNLLAMLKTLRAQQTPALLIAVPQMSLLTAATGRFKDHPLFEEVALETRTPSLENAWSEVLSQAPLRADQVHANAQGYKVFTDSLEAKLRAEGYLAT